MNPNLSKRQANKLARLKPFGAKVVEPNPENAKYKPEVVYDEGVKTVPKRKLTLSGRMIACPADY